MENVIKFFALGGLDEDGKNLYCLDINGSLFIIDSGIKFPESGQLGVDLVIPKYDFLVENQHRIKGIFISHGHLDAMGSLVYLLRDIKVKIFATDLTAWLIEDDLRENGIGGVKIFRIRDNCELKFGDVTVRTFHLNHSIDQTIGFIFETKDGSIVYATDYIVDFENVDDNPLDINLLSQVGNNGVLALLTESISANRIGFTSPNHKITSKIEDIIEDAPGRIFASVYTYSIFNIKEIIDVGIKYNKRILIFNKDLQDLVHKLEKLGRPILPRANRCGFRDLNDPNILVIVSGSGSSIFEEILKIAEGEYENITLTTNDTFVVASPAIPGTEILSSKALDELYQQDLHLKIIKNKEVASMHASEEDLKFMLNILKPKYYIPVKGLHSQLIANALIGVKMKVRRENIFVMYNGEVVQFIDGEYKITAEEVDNGSQFVDGIGYNEEGSAVMHDRSILSRDGVIVIGASLDRVTKKIIADIDVQTRGFIFLKDSQYIIDEIKTITDTTISEFTFTGFEGDFQDLRQMIKDRVSKYVVRETGKKPMILSMVITI